jgi:hypothetical protein
MKLSRYVVGKMSILEFLQLDCFNKDTKSVIVSYGFLFSFLFSQQQLFSFQIFYTFVFLSFFIIVLNTPLTSFRLVFRCTHPITYSSL